MLMNRGSNVSSWLLSDILTGVLERPLIPRNQTLLARNRIAL